MKGNKKPSVNIYVTLFVSILSISVFNANISAGAEYWAKFYGGSGDDVAYSIQQTSDGGYVVAGCTGSFAINGLWGAWILRLDSSGNTVWEKTYGFPFDSSGVASSIQQTVEDGGFIVAGYTDGIDAGFFYYNLWLFKIDNMGNIIWEKTYGPIDVGTISIVRQLHDGDYILTGTRSSKLWVLKLDATGNIAWEKVYSGCGEAVPNSIQETADGGYIVAGETRECQTGNDDDFLVLKIDSNGSVVWEKSYGDSGTQSSPSIQQTSDGGYILGGTTSTNDSPAALILKLNEDGEVTWQKKYTGDGPVAAFQIQQTFDSGYVVSGYAPNFIGALVPSDVWILKTDNLGNILWHKNHFFGGNGSSVQQTIDGGYVLTGDLYLWWQFGCICYET